MSNPKPVIIYHSTNALPLNTFYRAPSTASQGITLHCAPSKDNGSSEIPRKPSIFRPPTITCSPPAQVILSNK